MSLFPRSILPDHSNPAQRRMRVWTEASPGYQHGVACARQRQKNAQGETAHQAFSPLLPQLNRVDHPAKHQYFGLRYSSTPAEVLVYARAEYWGMHGRSTAVLQA